MTTQEAIKTRIEVLEAEQAELKSRKELIDEVIEVDEELVRLKDKADSARKAYNLAKEALMNEPVNFAIVEKMKEIKADIKDLKELLSAELLGYYGETGSLTIDDGESIRQISFVGKAKKSNQPTLL